jgi:acyl carrier protein
MSQNVELNEIESRLTTILRDVLDDDGLKITPSLQATDVPGWDSLNHIRIVLTVEKDFGVKFSPAEITKLKNIGDFEQLIQSKIGRQ